MSVPYHWVKRSFFVFILICSNGLLIYAQNIDKKPKMAGGFLYERLLKTQKEYEEAMATGDSLEVAEMCYRMGKRYVGIGDYKTAQKWFIRSLRIREPLGPSVGLGKLYLFLGDYHLKQGHLKEGAVAIHKAVDNFKKTGTQHNVMGGYIAMAGVYQQGYLLDQKEPGRAPQYSIDSTLYYLQQAENIALSLKAPYDIANVCFLKGSFFLQSDYQRGITYLKKANTIFLKEKVTFGIINVSLALARGYLKLQQPRKAKIWLEQASYVADTARFGDHQQLGEMYRIYSIVHQRLGSWKEALKTHEKYHNLIAQTLIAEREGAIAKIEIEYQTQQKEAQLKAQKQELMLKTQDLNYQKKLIGIAIGIGLLTTIASIIFYRFFRRYKFISKQNELLIKEQNHRVKNHFQEITSMLTMQAGYLKDEGTRKAITEVLLRMEAMALLHQQLHNSEQQLDIDLAKFIPELVEGGLRTYNYFQLKPTYHLDVIHLHIDQALSLGLIINELITNSCKYAFPTQLNPALDITCQQSRNTIILKVDDHGPGFDPQIQRDSLGLKLIDAFAQALKGQANFKSPGNVYQLSFAKKNVSIVQYID
ncbi:histidine kinase dimerization/phosphoacceptor domain -containing protein [Tellurirhabdus bombi]|uniref:histidine kinase dimerization/phosphoacceptor domain -containing protein n=1 Tax=Tellurirhabdus bombi TaxID=2907205 RepID=UPI001F261A7C|nr:histidine kinase dimerization/phosphoacceptor domain -containing protein [Tellurirhabdus bombi]